MFKKINFTFFISLFFFTTVLADTKVYIFAVVDNEIITNHDIVKEGDYLSILNPNLKQLSLKQNLDLAKQSLINEIIKKKEISKFLNINEENPFVEDYISNLITKLNYKDQIEFEKVLDQKNNYTLDQVKEKIKIELLWNELIYKKYNNQVRIDKENLISRVNNLSKKTQKEYLISEILFSKKKDEEIKKIYRSDTYEY